MEKPDRMEALKAWRMQVKGKKLPYYVMPDHVLRAIVDASPTNLRELSRVPGMGKYRLEKYGESIIALLERYK